MSGAPPRGAPPPTGPQLPAAAQAPQVWNHLQVPNFYPRQPQAAHMSSDRATSRSPLTWHTPTPPEHQGLKGAPNLYRHTPTPPDLQKGAPNPLFRHTPTPPDPLKAYRHTPTPPDVQAAKAAANASYRHTPTPPDIAHSAKGASLYRNTPPPDSHKQAGNPLLHLQQMMPDRGGSRLPDPHRDNILMRGDALNFARLSPGLTIGSMDLSVSRSPRNGSQNGEIGIPMSLSVRDASKINSLDSTEISRIHQTSGYLPKPADVLKSASPTFNLSIPNPEAAKPTATNKRPVKKVDSILERLNNTTESPAHRASSPRSVIVSAHTLEDGRGSAMPLPIIPVVGSSNSTTFEPPCALSLKVDSYRPADCPVVPALATSTSPEVDPQFAKDRLLQSVIKESSTASREESPALNYSNDDSNESSNDSGKSKRRRKQAKTNKIESGDTVDGLHKDVAPVNPPEVPENLTISTEQKDNLENVSSTSGSDSNVHIPEKTVQNDTSVKLDNSEDADVTTSMPKTRRKTSSESETIDNIAAMIASTDSSIVENSKDPIKDLSEAESVPPSVVSDPVQTQTLSQVLSSPTPESKVEASESNDKSEHLVNSIESNETAEPSKIPEAIEEPVVQDKSKPPAETNCIFEVENELEKMFAGIEETADQEKPAIDDKNIEDTKPADVLATSPPPSKPGRKKKISRKSSDAASSGLLSSDENTPKKKKKPVKRKSGSGGKFDANLSPIRHPSKKMNKMKPNSLKFNQSSTKDAYDSGSNASSSKSRGPYVQIKGPRDSPLSVNVINTPIQEEDLDKPLQKIKTLKNKASLHVDRNFKKSKGLHTSTLSIKYDAMTTDASWICVFCKKGPHTGPVRKDTVGGTNGRAQNMGDLFGPYVISTDCPDYVSMMNDPKDVLFKGRPNKQGTFMQNKQSTRGKKVKLDEVEKSNFPNDEMYFGMTESAANSYEVWLHEDCAVWAPGLYLVGAKVVGLDAAVWSCCTMRCDHCGNLGATVACIKHGCQKTMHVNCARADLWSLSEDDFLVYCKEHKLP